MHCALHKLTTWLVLVAYMLSGISPAQQLVICLEPDGSVVLEAAEEGGCTPCGTEEASDEAVLAAECCPCVDIPLPTQDEGPQARPKSLDLQGSWTAVPPPSWPASLATVERPEIEFFRASRPRPAQRLELIRTVILRV